MILKFKSAGKKVKKKIYHLQIQKFERNHTENEMRKLKKCKFIYF